MRTHNTDNPTKWLWIQLETMLDAETLTQLHAGFDKQSKKYTRTTKIRQTAYDIRLFTKNQKLYPVGSQQYLNYSEKLKRRMARLELLKTED